MMHNNTTFNITNTSLSFMVGDITDQDTAAIVNAANSSLMGGGGVDGAIHSRGGPKILEECKEIRRKQWPSGLPTGKAIITTGGNLKAGYVIHTVGPVWKDGASGEPELLKDAYVNSLNLAVENGLKSISFPSISTGAYGYPIQKAARVVMSCFKEYLSSGKPLEEVRLVLFKQVDLEVYQQAGLEIL
jgi:O-acetyl-ADP-ribose deacetylase (regulator of RNase III)